MDTIVGTKQAAAWAAKAYDLHRKGKKLPDTWEYLGAGVARAAMRHKPTGIVYKVVKNDAYAAQAETEDRTCKELRGLEVPWILPSTLYRFKTPGRPLVTAMPFAPPDDAKWAEFWRSPLFRTVQALVSDLHDENVGFDPETGQPYVIDVGISYASAERFRNMNTSPSLEVEQRRAEEARIAQQKRRAEREKRFGKWEEIKRTTKYRQLNQAGKLCMIGLGNCACYDEDQQLDIFERNQP